MSDQFPQQGRYTRFNKHNPDGSGRFKVAPEYRKPEPPKPSKSQSAVEYILFGVFGLLIICAVVALYTSSSPKHKIVPNLVAQGMAQDRVNILFIGIGGPNHPSHDDLADSIMFVSLKPSAKQVAVTSIPRDLWVRIGGYGTHRINYAHAIGNQSGYPGEGPGLLCDTVSKVLGQPVHAFVRVDFSSFEKVIDEVGGIDVYCQRSFYDYLFKDGFTQGWQHLSGKRALAYARYRYILGPEGDNFARELRQQQVINALKDKLQKRGPQEIVKMMQAMSTLSSATETNITPTQLVSLYRTFKDTPRQNVRHVSLKPFTDVFVVTRLAEAGDAVKTKTGDFSQLHAVERNIFSSEQQIATEDQIQFTPPPQAAPAAAQASTVNP